MSCRIQSSRSISIHLMLRFIRENISKFMNFLSFQYISCYGLSMLRLMPWLMFRHFNTSHVTVYQIKRFEGDCKIIISIHLMLRFINSGCDWKSTLLIISIHLMLRFIFQRLLQNLRLSQFQYISCYGLSSIKYIVIHYTSKFQYISCYGLSMLDRQIRGLVE